MLFCQFKDTTWSTLVTPYENGSMYKETTCIASQTSQENEL